MREWINFAELRAKISLEDVIVRLYGITTLKKDGDKLVGPCPVHGGDSPRAFHADLTKNVWHCFSKCQKGGNQLDFVAAKDNISIRDAALKLQAFFLKTAPASKEAAPTPPKETAPAGGALPDGKKQPEEPEGNEPLNVKLDLKPDHPHLVEERKLKLETLKHFGIGYCSRGIMRGTIAIPIHDEEGELIAYAGRRLKPSDIREFGKYKFPKGFKKELVVYNLNRAKEHQGERGLILVEGFFSVVKLYEAGFPNVVAAMGCELSDAQARLLADAKEVIVLFDGNEAGYAGAKTASEKLKDKTTVRLVKLPSGLEPEDLSAKALRWLVAGLQVLDLTELSFAFEKSSKPATP
jgi:DNA primase